MPNISNDAVELYYEVAGTGTPLLFLHGYTATVSLWAAQASFFEPDYQVICLDQRGHGLSTATEQERYTLEAMASDVLALLDSLAIEQVILIGHSMGGMVAQYLLSYHNDRCRGVVLSSTTPNGPPREYFEPTVEWAVSLGDIPPEQRAADPMMRSSTPISEATARGCGEMMMAMAGFTGLLEGNSTPCLIIHGSDESDGLLNGSRALAAVMPESTETAIGGAGHVPQITHSAKYNHALSDFFRQLP
jgi:3-oxoadipate enol-lactonase